MPNNTIIEPGRFASQGKYAYNKKSIPAPEDPEAPGQKQAMEEHIKANDQDYRRAPRKRRQNILL
jgi:hypothetical protein